MYKIIAVLFLIVAVAKGLVNNVTTLSNNYPDNPAVRNDDFISLIRQQYAKNLQDFDEQMEKKRQIINGRMDAINLELDMVIDVLKQTEERLNPLEVLSAFTKACVMKYRSPIPTVASTKTSIASCASLANSQVNIILNAPLGTKNVLENYYTNYFEKEIINCGKKFDNTTANYTICVTSVTTTTNTFTISNQKTFAIQMDTAECSANANIKKAMACSFSVNYNAISLVAEANAMIDKCLKGLDDCSQCNQGYSCPNVYHLNSSEVDYKNTTMSNPFYGLNSRTDCLMLKIQ